MVTEGKDAKMAVKSLFENIYWETATNWDFSSKPN